MTCVDSLFREQFWTPGRKPESPIEIACNHPLARGLNVCFVFNEKAGEYYNPIARVKLPTVSELRQFDQKGMYINNEAGSTIESDQWPINTGSEFTVACEYKILDDYSIGGTANFIKVGHDSSLGGGVLLQHRQGGGVYTMRVYSYKGTNAYTVGATVNGHRFNWVTFAATRADGDLGQIYQYGEPVGSQSTNSQYSLVTDPRPVTIYQYPRVRYLYFWNRLLSPDEIASVALAPYQFLQPVIRRVWVPGVVVGGGASFDFDPGSFLFPGQNISFAAATAHEVSPSSFTFLGQPVTVSQGESFSLSAGGFAFLGRAFTSAFATAHTLVSGAFSWTEKDLTFTQGELFSVLSGAFSFIGKSVTWTAASAFGLLSAAFAFITWPITATWPGVAAAAKKRWLRLSRRRQMPFGPDNRF